MADTNITDQDLDTTSLQSGNELTIDDVQSFSDFPETTSLTGSDLFVVQSVSDNAFKKAKASTVAPNLLGVSMAGLPAISSGDIATDDLLLLQDVSANELKKVTASEILKITDSESTVQDELATLSATVATQATTIATLQSLLTPENIASNCIDDTQARSDRMYSSSKVNTDFADISSNAIQLNEGDNLNDFTESGTYICSGGAKAKTLINCPYTSTNFRLIVYRNVTNDNYGGQIIISGTSTNNAIYKRGLSASGWGNWDKLITESDIGSFTKQVSNARLIGASDEKAEANKPCTVISGASGIPSNFSHGARTVKWVSANEIYVELIGVDTTGNLHKYISGYINKVWKDWKEL